MVECCNDGVMAKQASISDGDAALILEGTPGIDKHKFSDMNILSEIGVKRRYQAQGPVHGLSGQFGKEFLDLL